MAVRQTTPNICEHCGRALNGRVRRFCAPACYDAWRKAGAATRFWQRVRKTETCWLWDGPIGSTGYGKASVSRAYRDSSAHRVAWTLTHGPIPEGLSVLHNCPSGDNPRCVNPAHLFLGTHVDNMADMATKQRAAHGERQHHAKLTEDAVRQIREARRAGATPAALAAQFGVDVSHINHIVRRDAWKHVK